jgi:phosphatidylserine/phosphatidylglycerophosphate/cardiolipin synthase-like enzyme
MKILKIFLVFIVYLFFVLCIYNKIFYNKKLIVKNYAYKNIDTIKFLKDLTYEKDDKRVVEQEIFANIYDLIEKAEEFIVVDMFLYNDEYDKTKDKYPELSKTFTEKLINKKMKKPSMEIVVITDEINNLYGSYESKHIKRLKENGIKVVISNMEKYRDSNPIYSIYWRLFCKIFGTKDANVGKNLFNPNGTKMKISSFFRLLNFKANHRKVIISEKEAIISSANPHDPSFYHSNIAFRIGNELVSDILKSEQSLVGVSAENISLDFEVQDKKIEDERLKAKLITEGRIKEAILEALNNTNEGDIIHIGIFYFAERKIVKSLISASKRGVEIKIIMDSNKDAFGKEKVGIPNRQVAYELYKKSKKKIQIRWYNTTGEQFHSKFIHIKSKENSWITGGSANYTRRNIGDYNLETNIAIIANNETQLVKDIESYYNKLWNNIGGEYTLAREEFYETSKFKYYIYRIQEFTGLSTF